MHAGFCFAYATKIAIYAYAWVDTRRSVVVWLERGVEVMMVGRKGGPARGAVVVCAALSLWGCAQSAVGNEPFEDVSEPGTEAADAGGAANGSDASTGGGSNGTASGGSTDGANSGGSMTGGSGAAPDEDAGSEQASPDAGSFVDAAVDPCSPGTTLCGELCVDLQSSAANCGACGRACPGGQACNGQGACLAPAGCSAASYGGHDYFYCTNAKTWQEARNDCKGWGLDLAVIEAADENAFLKVYPGWIALNDISNEGVFLWVAFGGVNSGPSAPYTNWKADEPNNDRDCGLFGCSNSAGEDCAEIYADGLWNDARCDRTRAYLCESY